MARREPATRALSAVSGVHPGGYLRMAIGRDGERQDTLVQLTPEEGDAARRARASFYEAGDPVGAADLLVGAGLEAIDGYQVVNVRVPDAAKAALAPLTAHKAASDAIARRALELDAAAVDAALYGVPAGAAQFLFVAYLPILRHARALRKPLPDLIRAAAIAVANDHDAGSRG